MVRTGITIGILIVILQLFLFINADFIFGSLAEQARQTLIVYLIMLAVVLAATQTALPTLKVAPIGFVYFLVAFVLTSFVVMAIPATLATSYEFIILALGFGMLYAVVKAFIEEVVFRGVLINYLGNLGQAIVFGLFHASMLTGLSVMKFGMIDWWFVLSGATLLGVLGYIWGIMALRLGRGIGILASWGSHFSYNLGALGLLGTVWGFSL